MDVDLPPRAMFDVCVPIRRRTRRLAIDGDLSDWSDDFLLPDLAAIDGTPGFATVRMAWDEKGLYFALEVPARRGVSLDPKRPYKEAFLVWIDTRDVRDAPRAGRFCHQFVAVPGPAAGRKAVAAWQEPIRRAREQAPICRPEQLATASIVRPDGYSLEIAIPAAALNGYDPSESPRLGMTYMVTSSTHGKPQLWNVPPHLPFAHDPSTWAVIELVR
jgi:hypothetical protein